MRGKPHRMGAHAVARDAAGGVGGAEEDECRVRRGRSLAGDAAVIIVIVIAVLASLVGEARWANRSR